MSDFLIVTLIIIVTSSTPRTLIVYRVKYVKKASKVINGAPTSASISRGVQSGGLAKVQVSFRRGHVFRTTTTGGRKDPFGTTPYARQVILLIAGTCP